MPRPYWIATSIAVLGTVVLIYWLSIARPMWVDEEMLALNVRDRSFAELAGPLWLDQSAPFGWLVLERLLMLAAGTSEPAVRTLTIFYGVATLAVATWIGRRWMTPLGAAVLVSMCAFGEWIFFFTLELKHYSADTFWALFLPALAAAVLEDASGPTRFNRHVAAWWLVAAVGVWFGNSAVFVTPACAAAIVIASWRLGGSSGAVRSAVPGILWLASVGAAYAAVLRHALANQYLKEYWAFAFPPVSDGAGAVLRSFVDLARPFATKPGGSHFPLLFWTAYATGLGVAVARQPLLGLMFAMVPVSGITLALFHVVPIFERLALWIVPSLYVAVAMCADAALWVARPRSGRRFITSAIGVLSSITALAVATDVVWQGVEALAAKPRSNYGLDDRSSVRRLLALHRPGDAIATTHYGLAALWWYGGLDISDADRTERLPDGSAVFELRHVPDERQCESANSALDASFDGRGRLAVYLGFRLNVLPVGFDTLVLRELSKRASLVSYKQYAEESVVAVFDAKEPSRGQFDSPPAPLPDRSPGIAAGCVTIVPARRW